MNKFILPDGRALHVIGSNILVQRVELPQVSPGGIIFTDRQKEDATAMGIIRAVGHLETKKGVQVPLDVEVGMHCAFLWFYAERHTNQQVRERIGDDLIFLKWEDITLVWSAEDHYDICDIRSMGR